MANEFKVKNGLIVSGSADFEQDLRVRGTLTVDELHTSITTSSIIYESGSTVFGNSIDDIHTLTGSVNITGSISLNGQAIGTGKLDETTFNSFTASHNVTNTEFGNLTSSYNSFTSSYNTNSGSFNTRVSNLESFSSSLDTSFVNESEFGSFSSSVKTYQSNLNTYTGSLENRLYGIEGTTGSLNTFTASVNGLINSATSSLSSSIAATDLGQNNRLGSLELKTGSYATTGSNTFYGLQVVSGSILPSADNAFSLGSPSYKWKDVYISSGSLYIDNTKVLSSTAQELIITTDTGQSIKILEGTTDSIVLQTADGNIELKSSAAGDILIDPTNGKILLKGTVEVLNGQKIQSSVGGTPVVFANDIVVSGSVVLTGTIDGVDLSVFETNTNNRLSSIESNTGSLNSFTASTNSRLGSIESTTSSLNSYTSSNNSRLNTIEGTTGSLNSYTSSNNTRLNSIESTTSSLNSYTSSNNTRLNGIETTTGSLNTFTSSTNSRLNLIETSTSSLNTFTSSANGRLNSLESASSSIRSDFNSFTSSNNSIETTQNNRLTSIETTTGSLNTFTSSASGRLTSIETATSSLNTYTTSNNTRLGNIETSTGSLNTFTSSINTTIKNKLNSDGVISGSIQVDITQTTGYSTFSGSISSSIGSLSGSVATTTNGLSASVATYNLGQDNRLNSLEGKTGSYATTGSNIFQGSQTITGSLFISQNLIVAGSSSINYVSQSTLNIGTNLITVNAQNPSTRFGGLAVIDSGSSPTVSGSMLFDSVNNQWIFIHQNQSSVTSSILLMGPQTFNNVGNESYPTINKIIKSLNAEHLGDSNISDNGTTVSINSNTEVTGSLIVTGTVSGTNITSIQSSVNSLNSYTSSNTTNINAIQTATASLNSYTSSNNTRLNGIESTTASLNTFTSSTNTRLGLIETSTGSLNTFSSSTNTRLGLLETSTGSLNSYTSSNTTNINAIQTATASLNTFTSSTNTRLSSIETSTGSLNTFTSSAGSRLTSIESTTSSFSGRLSSIETSTGSLNSFTSSQNTFNTAHNTATASLNSYTSSTNTRLGSIETATSSLNSFTNSINTTIDSRLNTKGVVSGSSQITYSGLSGIPSGIVSGSSQIVYGSISGVPSGIVSGSSQVSFTGLSNVPGGLVSGSSQIDLTSTTNYASGIKTRLDAVGVISGSAQVSYGSISGVPSGLVSGSSQITLSSTTGFSTYLDQAVKSGSTVTFASVTSTAGLTVSGTSYYTFNKPSTSAYQTVALFGTTSNGIFITSDSGIVSRGAYYNNGWIATDTFGSYLNFNTSTGGMNLHVFSGATVGNAATTTNLFTVARNDFSFNSNAILHAGNYSSYALPLSGGSLTGGLTGTTFNFAIGARNFTSYNYGVDLTVDTVGGWAQSLRFYNKQATTQTWFFGAVGTTAFWTFGNPASIDVTGYNGTGVNLSSAGTLTAVSFSGAGTGLTGTASSLSIGGNAATVTNGVYTSGDQSISGTKTFAVIKGDSGSDYPHSFTNTDAGNTHWTNRGSRLLTSNGTNWAGDGKDPIMAIVGSTSATTRGRMIGLTLHNDDNTDSAFSPMLTFSSKSNSAGYNTVYASISGRKTGYVTNVDTNWAKGELHFFAHGDSYINDTPTFRLTNTSAIFDTTLTVNNSALIYFNTSNAYALRLDSSSSSVENDLRFAKGGTDYGAIQTNGSDHGFEFYVNTDGTGNGWQRMFYMTRDASENIFARGTVRPGANGTQDLGTSSYRWSTVYTSDLSLSNGIGDYTIVEGENDLFLYNNKQNKVYKFMLQEVDPKDATPKKS